MTKRTVQLVSRLQELGFSFDEAMQLRRIEMTLQRWGELECGDGNDHSSWSIERDEVTDKPYLVTYPHTGKSYRRLVPGREKGALKRLATIMARHPSYVAYHQPDCRGCGLYLVKIDKDVDYVIHHGKKVVLQDWLARNYTRGLAVCD
jgi:hypothetical protein